MGLLARLFNIGRMAPPDPQRAIGSTVTSFVPFDLRVSQEEMQSASVAWGSIRLIVDSLATREIKVFTRGPSGRREHIIDDPVSRMLNGRPNPDLTAQAFKEIVWTQTLLDGDGFALINRDQAQRPVELWPLDSRCMQVLRNPETRSLVYRYFHPDTAEIYDLAPSEVLHFRGPSIRGLTGDSVLYRAAKALSLSVAQERYATSYYANGASPGGILKPPQSSTRKSSKEEDERLRLAWKKAHGAAKGMANSLAILDPGWEYEQLETDAQKSQIVPARQFSVEDVARYFGVPLVLLGVQAAAQGYGTNVSQLYLVFVQNTLTPWSKRFTEEAQYKLFPQRAPWRELEIDTSPLLRGDQAQSAAADEIAIRSGKLVINEARARDGLNSIGPEGDVPLVQNTLTTLVQVAADVAMARLKSLPQMFQYHLELGLMTKNEARARLGLPPMEGGDVLTEPVQVAVDDHRAQVDAGDGGSTRDADEAGKRDASEELDASSVPPERPGVSDASTHDVQLARVSVALDRYARRLNARRRDLEKNAPDKVEANLVLERSRVIPLLVGEVGKLTGAPGSAITAIAAAVEQGEPVHLAAQRLIGRQTMPAERIRVSDPESQRGSLTPDETPRY